MSRRRLLLLWKPLDVFPARHHYNGSSSISNSKISSHLESRRQVHKDAINFCQDILRRKSVVWEPMLRSNLSQPIRNVDLVITVGGDGTLLKASHFMDDSVPVLGVNSDPTQVEEVKQFIDEFDATRSTGYLCAATVNDFEQVLDGILENQTIPDELSRVSVCINSQPLPVSALNDTLMAHPCPAAVSRFSFRLKEDGESRSSLVNCRSSGLRVSTAAGSTAAMLSAGGFGMPMLSKDLQYMVREPISPASNSGIMHGLIRSNQTMELAWSSKEGVIYVDGSHLSYPIQLGDVVELSSRAPSLKIFLPPRLLLRSSCI